MPFQHRIVPLSLNGRPENQNQNQDFGFIDLTQYQDSEYRGREGNTGLKTQSSLF